MSRYDALEATHDLSPEAIQGEVARILASEKFARSKRLRRLLRFTVAQTLQGNGETPKEYGIGTAAVLRVKLKEYHSDPHSGPSV